MNNETQLLLITISSIISGVLLCFCFKYCKDKHQETQERNRLQNTRKHLMVKHRIKPIIQINEHLDIDEFKDEIETRNVQPTGDQNV